MSVFLNSAARNEKLISNLARDQKSLATPDINHQNQSKYNFQQMLFQMKKTQCQQ